MRNLASPLVSAVLIASFAGSVARADLFDSRSEEAARRQAYHQEQARQDYLTNVEQSMRLLAQEFGAVHGGVAEVTIIDTRHFRFVSGDGHACESYIFLSDFRCYDSQSVPRRFWVHDFVTIPRDFDLTGRLYPRSHSRTRSTSRHRAQD